MTPSQKIIAQGAQAASETIRDASGREIEVRLMRISERRKFTRMCGAAADIDRWFGEAMLAAQVRAINGVPVPMPRSADEVDNLVETLGDEGMTAVAEWIQAVRVPTRRDVLDEAGNSPGTAS